jgi:HK97 family phage major capsid protein
VSNGLFYGGNEMETRKFEIGRVRADNRTAEATLSSEYPVRRFDGSEVLSHEFDAVDLSRAPLPLIVAHDGSKLPVGVVEDVRVVDKKLKGTLRFSKNADGIWNDVKDGILRNLSIGYQIIQRTKTKAGYIATKWLPYECSLVAAGADPMAGIGRNFYGGLRTMDKNDLLKERKRATDEMISIAGQSDLTSETKEKFDRIKDAVESYDRRLEVLEDVDKLKKPEFQVPDTGEKRDLSFEGGPAADASYRSMFGTPAHSEEEIRAFRASMETGIPSSGGMSVPEPLSAKWLDDSLPQEIIRPKAQIWPMTTSSRKIAGWDWGDMSGGAAFGGFTMAWTEELGTASKQTGSLRTIQLNANKGQIYCDVSQELYDDGLGFAGQLERALKTSVGYGLEEAFTNGTGVGQPLGLINDSTLQTITKETGQAADTVTFEGISKMYARMYPAGRSKAIWLVNDTVLPALLTQLNVAIGTSGSWVNVFDTTNGKFTLLGRPVLFTSHLPVLGDANDILFVDLSQYAIGLRKEMRIERSQIPMWTTDQQSYRVITRVDAQGTWGSAYSPDNGDDMSWAVAMPERA